MFGGGQPSRDPMLHWIEETFLSALLTDSNADTKTGALASSSVIIMISIGLQIMQQHETAATLLQERHLWITN